MKLRMSAVILATALLGACGEGGNSYTPAAPVAATPPPAGQDWTQTVSKTEAGGYVMGNPNAPLKLVEYGSRTCPTCGAFGKTGQRPLEETYVKSGKVSYEFRDFLVHGAPDLAAALLGRCAGPAPFFPVLEQMYQDQEATLNKQMAAAEDQAFVQRIQTLSPPEQAKVWADRLGYVDFIKQRGVPEAQARTCLADTKAIDELAKMSETAMRDAQITGTPTFILNGNKLDGAVTWKQVEDELKRNGA